MRRFGFNLRGIRLLLIFAGAFWSFGSPCLAETVQMGISPDRFAFAASPGETVSASVVFSNGSDSTLPIRLDASDFRPDGEGGKIAVDGVTEAAHSLAAWIVPRQSERSVGAHDEVPLDFDIHVPPDAKPGAHWGVLVFRTQGAYHLGAIILLNVRGSVPETLTIASFESAASPTGALAFVARIRNDGKLYEKPKNTITVRNILGQTVAEDPQPAENILPGYIRRFTTKILENIGPGVYSATLKTTYGERARTVEADKLIWISPSTTRARVALASLAAVGLLLLGAAARTLLRRTESPTK